MIRTFGIAPFSLCSMPPAHEICRRSTDRESPAPFFARRPIFGKIISRPANLLYCDFPAASYFGLQGAAPIEQIIALPTACCCRGAALAMRTLHPQWAGYTFTWWRDRDLVHPVRLLSSSPSAIAHEIKQPLAAMVIRANADWRWPHSNSVLVPTPPLGGSARPFCGG
jgi:hypothetical protein